ncbi:hypothetical protein J6590_034486 [Homalodisca vitripennis]|nr:hypothetical protein J6590_034486 [Homalodisca vitripennis]
MNHTMLLSEIQGNTRSYSLSPRTKLAAKKESSLPSISTFNSFDPDRRVIQRLHKKYASVLKFDKTNNKLKDCIVINQCVSSDVTTKNPVSIVVTKDIRLVTKEDTIQKTSTSFIKSYPIHSTIKNSDPEVTLSLNCTGSVINHCNASSEPVDKLAIEIISIPKTKEEAYQNTTGNLNQTPHLNSFSEKQSDLEINLSLDCVLPLISKKQKKEKVTVQNSKNSDLTLPGFHYLGPGGKSNNGPPTNPVDAIAMQHDLAYDQVMDEFKRSHDAKHCSKEIRRADQKFLHDLLRIKAGPGKEALGKAVGLLGIGLKVCVEKCLDHTVYPDFCQLEEIINRECQHSSSDNESVDEDGVVYQLIFVVDRLEPEEVTTPPTPAPTPVPNCKLPLYPASDPAVTPSSGLRFGTKFGSRLEYGPLPGRLRNKFEFSINIKTVSTEGIILYVHDSKHIDFIALYLKDGRVHYGYNCGSGAALLESDLSVNDGEWHNVRFSRVQTSGKLIIDDVLIREGESRGSTKTINVMPPLYLGGIDPRISDNTKTNLMGLNNTFEGCLKDFTLNDKPVISPSKSIGVIPCSDNVEAGAFFSAAGGYIKFSDRFRVGVEIDIKLEIKPRDLSGVLVSVHSKRDYLLLQMVDGTVRFSVDNGKGEIWAAYTPPTPHYFCDGQWHNIQAVKSKNVVSLSVDKTFVNPGIGISHSTDTKNPLFIGGHPHKVKGMRGLLTHAQFTGCIRNLEINGRQEALSHLPTFGNVTQSVCPTI